MDKDNDEEVQDVFSIDRDMGESRGSQILGVVILVAMIIGTIIWKYLVS